MSSEDAVLATLGGGGSGIVSDRVAGGLWASFVASANAVKLAGVLRTSA